MQKLIVGLLIGCGVLGLIASAPAATLFFDDFESGLNNWIVGGRQAEGTNIADTVPRHGSLVGHLFKFSFTEITLEHEFRYDPNLRFAFDMEVIASSADHRSDDSFYGMSGVEFLFLNDSGESMGRVSYATATTPFPFQTESDPTKYVQQVSSGELQSYSFHVLDILSNIEIELNNISKILLRFYAYSSTRPTPNVTAELWVDNVLVDNSLMDESFFGGSTTGVFTENVICWNLTTGISISFQTNNTSWNCESAGLTVNSGDRIFTGVEGIVK